MNCVNIVYVPLYGRLILVVFDICPMFIETNCDREMLSWNRHTIVSFENDCRGPFRNASQTEMSKTHHHFYEESSVDVVADFNFIIVCFFKESTSMIPTRFHVIIMVIFDHLFQLWPSLPFYVVTLCYHTYYTHTWTTSHKCALRQY